jgi:hypothetical protein
MFLREESGDLFHLKVGDRVMVQTHSRTVEAEVIKRGRVYVTVLRDGHRTADEFNMEKGQYRYEGNLRLFSMEQYAANKRRSDLVAGLREAGIDLRHNHELTLETQEKILEVIREQQP